MQLDEFRTSLDAWLDDHHDELAPGYAGTGTLDLQMAQLAKVKARTFDAGWMRRGWPERVGGLPGSTLQRAYLGEALTARDLVEPGLYSMTEVLAPTMIDYAPPDLAAAMVPRLLRGEETWCQGFSEPGTGSNLAALSCRAVRTDRGWTVTGQKVWTSLAQYAQRCVLLTRTGDPDSAHRGITALFVDMDTPGLTMRPIETMHGALEFCEVFFDDVAVPADRTLGAEGQGWAVAMDLLPFERSTALWHRAAYLHRRLQQLLEVVAPDRLDPVRLGEVTQLLYAFRARSRATQHRLAAGERLGPETSVDKVLVATAEQAVFDLVADGLAAEVVVGDDPASERWRTEFLYSRAATIYGGSAEIQRNIIARRLLDLGERPMMDQADRELFERSLRHATEQHTGAALDLALEELGWREALDDDPRVAVSVLFELQGGANAWSSALDALLVQAVGPDESASAGAGRRMVLPPIPGSDPPGRLRGSTLDVHGIAAAQPAGDLLVLASGNDGSADGSASGSVDVVAVAVAADLLDLRPVDGMDPALGWVEVHGQGIDTGAATHVPAPDWTTAVARVRLALAHQMVGAARQMLDQARTHALERIQFGVPISSFQAVRHRLAETLVAIETAEALIDAAWLDATPATAAMAKALAGREARTAARHCQQVLAGIGFTTEHDFQRYFRRVRVLDSLFGSSAALTRALGDDLLADRHLPPLLPL